MPSKLRRASPALPPKLKVASARSNEIALKFGRDAARSEGKSAALRIRVEGGRERGKGGGRKAFNYFERYS